MPNKPPHIVFTQPLPTKGQYKVYSVATSESLGMIKGDNKKRYWEAFDNEGKFLESAERKKQLMDFFRDIDKKSRMGEGGGIGFEKLSDKVAKNYEGKKVAPKYQHEYGKRYSKAEAKEVGDKVAGKVYWQQQGRMAKGGGIELYDDEGNPISLKIGDIVVEYKKPTPNQEKRIIGGQGEIVSIVGAMAKVFYKSTNYEEFIALKDLKKVDKIMKTGGNIKKYEYSPSIEEQKTWDEKKTRIYDAYVNSYNTYQDLLEERKRAIGRNDKDEVKSIDLRLKNKQHVIKYAYSELTGITAEQEFKDGGNLDSLDARISKAIFQAYGNIDDAIEFKQYYTGHGVSPYRLVFLAVQKGFITPEEINKAVLDSAYETSSETEEAEEIGSSDMNNYVFYMLRDAGFDMKIENGTFMRVGTKMATGGTTDKMDEYIRQNRERQAKEEEGKYFAPYRAFVYEDSYQFADFKTDDFHKAVKWAKETLEAQRTYRKNTESMWAIVDEFTPIEERGNVIYPYKEVARFTEENTKEMKFGNGGNTTFYYDQAKKTLGEHLYNHIASLNKEQLEIHLSHLQKEIERMKANDTEFTKQEFLPKYKQEEKFILYLLERLDEFKYADGGNVEEDQEYYRVFRNNAGKDVAVKILKNPIFGKYDYYVDGSLRGQFDTFAQARAEVNYENFDMYKDGGNIYSKEESLQIARTILQQMGGQNRLVAFTGAYGFAYADGDVSFRIKNRKVNYVKVKLNGKDLYDVTFGRVSGTNFKVVEQLDDVYAEDLIDIFEKSTGMYLRFEKGGKMAKGGGVGNELNIGTNIEFLQDLFVTQESDEYDAERPIGGKVLKIVKKDENNNIYYLKDTAQNLTRDDRFPYIIGFNKLNGWIENKFVKIHNDKMARGGGIGNEKKKDIISFDYQTRTFQGDKEPLEDIIRKTFNIERRFPPILNFDKSAMELEFTEYVSEDELKSEQYKTDLFKKVQAVKSKIEGLYNLSVNYYTNDAESWNNFENSLVITVGEKKNYDGDNTFFAKGGGIEDEDFMSQARTSARESIDWEEELRNYAGDNYKSLTAKEKEEIIAEMKANYDYNFSYAKGGLVVTSIKDIPNFKEENEAGRITYRGLGMGKLSNDFYKIAGESGTRIKVKGKEYYITMTEFNTFNRDSSGKMRIKFDAPFRKFADGGSINKIQDLFPEEKMIKLLKSIKFKQFDSSEIKKAEYTTETYNPFDKNFYAKIRLYPCLITIDQVDNNSYEVRIGEDSGWIGGISYGSWEYVFEISNVNYAEFEKGLKKAVADKTIVLYNTWTSGGVRNFYFVGSLEEAKKFAKENGYEYKRSYGKPYFYYFHNPTQEKLNRWNDENKLYIGKFTSRQIARGTAQSTKGIKQLEHAQIKKARGGEIFNSEFYKEGGSIDINFATDTNYIKRENIKLVNYKNGKELYNWDYWDSTNTPDNHNGFYSGLYVAKKPLPNTEPDKQYSMFKKGGKLPKSEWEKLPKSAFYINRWDIASVIVYDEKLGEEIEIPANRIVNGIWFDNERTQMIVDRAKKEGLIPDKTKKTTTFIARFNGKKIELEAKSMFDAEQKALKELKVPKSKKGLLSVMSKQAYERGDFQFN